MGIAVNKKYPDMSASIFSHEFFKEIFLQIQGKNFSDAYLYIFTAKYLIKILTYFDFHVHILPIANKNALTVNVFGLILKHESESKKISYRSG